MSKKDKKQDNKRKRSGEDGGEMPRKFLKHADGSKQKDQKETSSVEVPPMPVLSAVEFRATHKMELTGKNETSNATYECPAPILKFSDAPFNKSVLAALASTFDAPTPIQSQAWPIVLEGRDIISVARTGSGKTLGFLLPLFDKVLRLQGGKEFVAPAGIASPLAIVLAPTRELAMQIQTEVEKYGYCYRKEGGIRSVCLFGGDSKYTQITALRNKMPQVVVATPGRLNDLAEMSKVSLLNVAMFVLDEADKMLDMGFGPQLEEIQSKMAKQLPEHERPLCSSGKCGPTSRQTLLFSATWPKSVQRMAYKILHNPVQLNVGDSTKLVANEKIKQRTLVVGNHEKMGLLEEELKKMPQDAKVLVFCNTKRRCDTAANQLWESGMNCDALHGDKEQRDRTRIMKAFSTGQVPLLFATDVAARGLDVKDIRLVINFDFPRPKGKAGVEDFVHRIGRTGRGDANGEAVTFFTTDDKAHARSLVQLLSGAKQDVPDALTLLVEPPQRGRGGAGGGWNGGRHSGSGSGGRSGYGGRSGSGRSGYGQSGSGRSRSGKRW